MPPLTPVIARSAATKQSILALRGKMYCFASLAMTAGAMDCFAALAMTGVGLFHAASHPRHCEERSDEAIHSFFARKPVSSRGYRP